MIDTAPRAVICFEGKCEETTLHWTFSNNGGARDGGPWIGREYANGWRLDYVYNEGKTYVSRNGKPVDAEPACRPIDKFGCG
jgi:hypothetical protein